MAGVFRRALRRGFDQAERGFDVLFGPEWNPIGQLGALGWFLFWIVAATGIWFTGLDPKGWVCMHRRHHTHSDGPKDPHSPVLNKNLPKIRETQETPEASFSKTVSWCISCFYWLICRFFL